LARQWKRGLKVKERICAFAPSGGCAPGFLEAIPVITAAKLKSRTLKDLAEMARKKRLPGWHAMRKDDLVKALARLAKSAARAQAAVNGKKHTTAKAGLNGKAVHAKSVARAKPSSNGKPAAHGKAAVNGKAVNGKASVNGKAAVNGKARPAPVARRNPRVDRRIQEAKAKHNASKDLAFHNMTDASVLARDRLVVMVRDPYWLHAYWELSRKSIERATAAMGQRWHGARPVLRVTEVTRDGTTTSARQFVRDIEIHGGVNNWYIDVQQSPRSYQLEIGYIAADSRFFAIARSNVVTTPAPGSRESFDKNWADVAKDFDRIYALSGGYGDQDKSTELKEVLEERLRRPVGDPNGGRFNIGGSSGNQKPFSFEVDTELIVHGVTEPDARVTLRGEPVPLRPDGTFAVRFSLPDRRHVLPVVASSRDGAEQRTIVLAVDRNTKVMEPVLRDPGE
jgi:hypothetical protein